ncbi:MAG: ribonuclease HII [Nanoarchaeota archaeon]|nr:ribonuclease HII [Nanoarchaeota archaeon]
MKITLLGIDEAGRGPVLGPLVMAGALIKKESDEKLLADLGVKDSKFILPKKRQELYQKIIKLVKYKIIILEPEEIDQALKSQELNLNWLEAQTSAKIINHLKPKRAIIDCPSNNIKAYHTYLKSKIQTKTELILEHKAESHPVVAAASILAKVTRDNLIEKLKQKIKIDFGSGYMTDEKTVNFLKEHHQTHPEIFRKTWASYKRMFQKDLSEF